MGEALSVCLATVGMILVFNGWWLASTALFPRMVDGARVAYSSPFKTTGLGLLVVVPLGLLGAVLGQLLGAVGKGIGGLFLATLVFLALIGSTGLTQRIGLGMPSPLDESQPWRRVLRGGIVLSFVFLLPFFGWFLVLPWTLISGVGAAVSALTQFSKEGQAQTTSIPPRHPGGMV